MGLSLNKIGGSICPLHPDPFADALSVEGPFNYCNVLGLRAGSDATFLVGDKAALAYTEDRWRSHEYEQEPVLLSGGPWDCDHAEISKASAV